MIQDYKEPEKLVDGALTWDNRGRYIQDAQGAIVGRLSGAPGSYWYQIAARPYDKPAVMGFGTLEAGFKAACNSLRAVG